MPNYAKISGEMKKVFLEQIEELTTVFNELKDENKNTYLNNDAYLQTYHFLGRLHCIKTEMSNIKPEDTQDFYDLMMFSCAIHYFNDLAEILILARNQDFLNKMEPNRKDQENFVTRLKSIEKILIGELFLRQPSISSDFLKERMETNELELQGAALHKTIYEINFGFSSSVYQLYLINLVNSYAQQNTEESEYVDKLYKLLLEKTIKFNHVLHSKYPADGSELTASYYNNSIDQFTDLVSFGEMVATMAKIPQEDYLLYNVIDKLRKTVVALDIRYHGGYLAITNQDKHTISYEGQIFSILPGKENNGFAPSNETRSAEFFLIVSNDAGDPFEIKFTRPDTHVYTYTNPLGIQSNIDAVVYMPSKKAETLRMETYIYENKDEGPYIVYLSQVPGLIKTSEQSYYVCLDKRENIMSSNPVPPGEKSEVRLEIPADTASVLLIETGLPRVPDLNKPDERVFKRALQFINKKHMDPLAFK